MVICLERGADLHMFQLMPLPLPLPLTVSCFSKIQIGFAFLVPAHLGSPGKRAVKRVCVCVCNSAYFDTITFTTTNFFADESYFASQMIVIVCLILFVMCLCVILELILMRRLPPVTTALYSIEVWNTQRKGELNFKFLAIAVSPACKKTEW